MDLEEVYHSCLMLRIFLAVSEKPGSFEKRTIIKFVTNKGG